MKPSADVERLAAEMGSLRSEEPPRTLPILIGDLCAERAGVPKPSEIGRAVMQTLSKQGGDYESPLPPLRPDAPDSEVEGVFLAWLGGMTNLERYRVLAPFYRRVPVPLFYQDLADLVVSGFVTHILTTNVDTLLEQALDGVGLAAGRDYGVTVIGSLESTRAPDELNATTIIKLYGDLGQEQLPIGPGEIDHALKEYRSFLRSELAADLIVVGHQIHPGQTRAIDSWLSRGEGHIWWIHPEAPSPDLFAPIGAGREITLLTGEEGDPEVFFGQLSLHLISLPAQEVLSSAGPSSGVDLEHEFLKSRIEKAQVTKYSVEQGVLPGDEDVGTQAQIGYLADTAATYGSQLRELAPPDPQDLLTRLLQEASAADIEQSTVDFLTEQASIVRRELSSSTPNPLLVSGALSAANAVAQGLASQLSAGLTDELRSAMASYPGSLS